MKNRKKGFHSSRLWVYFALLIMVALFIILFIVSLIAVLLFRNGIITPTEHFLPAPFILLIAISAIIGGIVALFVTKTIMRPMEHLSNALSEVAKGNFSVQLDDKSHFKEINETCKNFNIMTKELAGIETLRTDFVVSVSHEFKTPIAAIEGYATLLQNPKLDKKTHDDYVEKVINNARNLSSLTGNILQLSKLENQEVITVKKNFSLDEQIRKTVLYLEQEWTEKNIDFDFDLPEINFFGNESLLYQVWYNIISNAIKFSHKDSIIKIILDSQVDSVTVKVTDYGCGIGQEALPHIFDKFYQEDRARSSSGNGLGLSLVKRIVTLCEGSVKAESSTDSGTTFTVILPKI